MVYNKLVRDRVPDIIKLKGCVPIVRTLKDGEEFQQALARKFKEEMKEFLDAEGKREKYSEAADIVEVVRTILKLRGVDLKKVERFLEEKRKRLGGFKGRKFLVSTK